MKSIAGLLLLVLFFHTILKPLFPVVNYQMNKAVFVEKCINKNKPVMKCEGKCQLAVQFKKSAEENKSVFHAEKTMADEVQVLCELFFHRTGSVNLLRHPIVFYKSKLLCPYLLTVFRPPLV